MCKIAKLIDDRLKERGIKGSKMCDDLNLSRSTLTELRKGRAKSLSPQTAYLISEYLDIDARTLMGLEIEPIPSDLLDAPQSAEEAELSELLENIRRSPDLRAMFSLTKNASPEEVKRYISVIKAIRGDVDE